MDPITPEQPPGQTPPFPPRTEVEPAQTPPPGPRPPLPPVKKPRPASFWIALVLFLLLGGSLLMNLGLMAVNVAGEVAPATGFYKESVVQGSGEDKIVWIEIRGLIMDPPKGALFAGPSVVKQTVKKLRQAAADPTVKAILLSVNSPGGGVTASDIICNEVRAAKKQGKKVIVHMGDLCASGGYYVSAPADHIVASPTTVTGSIGVILNTMDASVLLEEKLGIKQKPVKSGPHKDILSISRPMAPEERKILQNVVDDLYNRFVQVVREGRKGKAKFPKELAGVRKLADGRVFSGTQALKVGLVDEVGFLADAIEAAKKVASLDAAKVVRYKREPSLMDVLSGDMEGRVNVNAGVQVDAQGLYDSLIPRFEYRWVPGR